MSVQVFKFDAIDEALDHYQDHFKNPNAPAAIWSFVPPGAPAGKAVGVVGITYPAMVSFLGFVAASLPAHTGLHWTSRNFDTDYKPLLASPPRFEEAGARLADSAQALCGLADLACVALPCNTFHISAIFEPFRQRCASLGVRPLSLVEEVLRAVERAGLPRVGLVGTALTMQLSGPTSYYAAALHARPIQLAVPPDPFHGELDRLILSKLIKSVGPENYTDTIWLSGEVQKWCQAAGLRGVILGCTELPLLLSLFGAVTAKGQLLGTDIVLFDTTVILAQATVPSLEVQV